ncbi:site-specific integrase [Spirosoma pollinicola]|uniref:Integrase n=1 Tax=Spirosoma pollinicola TaxID=2057025 RepID=A0A2K8Z458_9BACT|nr:site-specific integrase [Spirosoma pollinicola]AUD04650.1 integrase [Spirosoma pollinicola]
MATIFLPTDRLPQVKVMLYTSKTLADGSHPLRLRITKDGNRKYVSIGENSPLNWWDVEKELPRRSHPEQKRLLTLIKKWETSYSDAAKQLHEIGHPFTIDMIIDSVTETSKKPRKDRKGIMLLSYLKDIYEQLQVAQRVGNANVYHDTRRVLAKFLHDRDCPLSTVNVSFLNQFETYLRSEKCADTTMSIYFRTLRAAINRSIGEKLLPPDLYPFSRHTSQRDKFSLAKFDLQTRKRAITKAEIHRVKTVDVATPRLLLARDVFMFSYYGGGINYVDIAQLRWGNVQGGRLQYVRQKTGGLFNLNLSAQLNVLLDYYRPLTDNGPDSYVFAILSPEKHQTPLQIANRLHKIKGQINQDLKVIGQLAGIETPLTTYVARHAFATALKQSGVSTAVISEAMGHQTESVTQTYLASFENDQIDEAFNHL